MPLDGHTHLVKQGWSGKGTGLRNGAIAKPITVTQKKTLAGIGKDRDEAFPFWDHVFQAAAVSIQVKLHKDSDDESSDSSDSEDGQTPAVEIRRTATGIISNRRPVTGTPALSGATTPSDSQASSSGSITPQLSLMAAAKQQAARRMLYSMFYRGPVIAAEDNDEKQSASKDISANQAGPSTLVPSSSSASASSSNTEKDVEAKKAKKRKGGADEEKREWKRRKHEGDPEQKSRSKGKGKEKATDTPSTAATDSDDDEEQTKESKAARKAAKAERKTPAGGEARAKSGETCTQSGKGGTARGEEKEEGRTRRPFARPASSYSSYPLRRRGRARLGRTDTHGRRRRSRYPKRIEAQEREEGEEGEGQAFELGCVTFREEGWKKGGEVMTSALQPDPSLYFTLVRCSLAQQSTLRLVYNDIYYSRISFYLYINGVE
ncbi:hypothetical protein ONZ51_g11865 [Trametes cubensis]|uniref:G-patch domain-containing protein n=1 Tax=Trametes cubensis TaxID=1111947 RepID=A0AAD7X534_9APHY|nr:hypothetical protein ONZ51_g11865 [Trametes cubensis]